MADFKRYALARAVEPSGAPGLTNLSLDTSTNAAEWIVQCAAAETITHLGVRIQSNTAPPTYRLSVQGVDASGNPDGTIKGSGTAKVDFVPSATGFQWFALDSSYASSRGEMLAIVMAYQSGTIAMVTNFSSVTTGQTNSISSGMPYVIHNVSGSRTRQTVYPIVGWKGSSLVCGNPLTNWTTNAFNSGSTSPEQGMRFDTNASWGDTFKVVGVRMIMVPAAGGTFTMRLYTGGSSTTYDAATEKQAVQFDQDAFQNNSAQRLNTLYFDESTLQALTFGESFRITFRAETTNNITIPRYDVASAADFGGLQGGADWQLTARSSGNWTDTATQNFTFYPIIDDWTEPAGGSDGLASCSHPYLAAAPGQWVSY